MTWSSRVSLEAGGFQILQKPTKWTLILLRCSCFDSLARKEKKYRRSLKTCFCKNPHYFCTDLDFAVLFFGLSGLVWDFYRLPGTFTWSPSFLSIILFYFVGTCVFDKIIYVFTIIAICLLAFTDNNNRYAYEARSIARSLGHLEGH